jgi:site-specific DNA-cytosine methylase
VFYAVRLCSRSRNLVPLRKVAKRNNPEIVEVGDVTEVTEEHIRDWGPFDLLLGGSPCNDFSLVNKFRQGVAGKTGKLFFYYARRVPRSGRPC